METSANSEANRRQDDQKDKKNKQTSHLAQTLKPVQTEKMNESPKTIYLKDYQQPDYAIENVKLSFDLYDDYTRVYSSLTIKNINFINNAKKTSHLILNGEDLKLISIKLNNKNLMINKDYELLNEGKTLKILEIFDSAVLEIETEIHPEKNTELSGLYWAKNLFCTQCEAQGFRRITYYLDRPDVMSTFETRIAADKEKYPVLLSNGNCIEKGDVNNQRHYAVWKDPFKKPCYLFALVAGDLVNITDHYVTQSKRLVTLKIFVERENQDKCRHAMEALKKAMRWDEETYDREYDLDIYMIVAVNDFNMGAMENKGLNIFNSKYILARPESATDRDYQLIDAVVGHEYFHNWSGNRITCRDWFQLSLKEGLTVFREHQFSSDIMKSPVSLIENVRALKTHQFTEDSSPLAHPVRPDSYIEINNFYTTTVYEKGAEVIRMLRTLIGKNAFKKGMDIYFTKYDGQAVTTDEFISAMSEAANLDLIQFKLWYTQAGTPEITVEETFDSAKKTYHLTLTQNCPPTPNQPEKLPMLIPIAIGLLHPETGEDLLPEKTQVLQLNQTKQTFEFKNINFKSTTNKPPVLSLLRQFSAAVKIKTSLSDQQLAFLMQHDSDDFSRWDASQQLVERFILKRYKNRREIDIKNIEEIETLWLEAMRSLLQDQTLHPALKAEMLALPSLNYLIEQEEQVNIDALYDARCYVRNKLINNLASLFLQTYQKNGSTEPYAFTPEQTAKRYLKNTALNYLAHNKDNVSSKQKIEPNGILLCAKQWHESYNMTDSFAALCAVSDIECTERETLLHEFYQRWHHDTNVIDKWFRVQATSELPNALENVQELLKHPDFSIKNPNKVYALLNAFAMANIRFHDSSGDGYEFIMDRVMEIDKFNPQVAARLLKSFSNWKKLDKERQHLIRIQLMRIKNEKGVSADLFEVTEKMLS